MPKDWSRRRFLQAGACLASTFAMPPLARAASGKPLNVVLIVADDMGWTGPACYGSDLHETPNIDRLAREGMRFTQAYAAAPVCSPTRASLMTGKHPARLNITTWRESALGRLTSPGDQRLAPPVNAVDLPLGEVTVAEVLREAGYHTAHVGKWHLGDAAHYPETQGFDEDIGGTIWGAPKTYWHPYRGSNTDSAGLTEFRYVPHLEGGKPGEYLTDRLSAEALHALDRAQGRPFFLHLAHHSPHTPIQGKPELVEHYQKKIKEGMTHRNAEYAAMVHSLDEGVGRMLDKLDELGVAENTMVVFISDNGGYTNVRDGQPVTGNAPLRSGKGSLYEGGIRVPLIVRWPGVVPANAPCEVPVVSSDLYPTFLEAAGLNGDAKHNEHLDGLSLMPLLRDPKAALDRDTLCWHFPHYYFNTGPVSAIRHGDWKLLHYCEDDHLELFDLSKDLEEQHDLATAQPEKAKELRDRLSAWLSSVDAKLPEENPQYDPAKTAPAGG